MTLSSSERSPERPGMTSLSVDAAPERQLARALSIVIKAYRVKKGLTQERLANDYGVNRTTVAQIELGLRNPSLATVGQLLAALDIDWATFGWDLEKALFEFAR